MKSLKEYKQARIKYFEEMRMNELQGKKTSEALPSEHVALYNAFQNMREDAQHKLYAHVNQACTTFLAIVVPLMGVVGEVSMWRRWLFGLSVISALCGVICGFVLMHRSIRIAKLGIMWLDAKEKMGEPFRGGDVMSNNKIYEQIAMKLIYPALPLAAIFLCVVLFVG